MRNYNRRKGYPEDRNSPKPKGPKTSKFPPYYSEPELPTVIPPFETIPKNWPRDFFRGVPRPNKFPTFLPFHPTVDWTGYTDIDSENIVPEFIINPTPEVEVPETSPEVFEEFSQTEFVELPPESVYQFCSYFEKH